MTEKLLIERELLERVTQYTPSIDRQEDRARAISELRSILESAPRQPEGEGLEVVAFYWLDTGYENPNSHGPYFGWPNEDALRRVDGGAMPIALCHLSDAQRAIAELREECEHLKACQENAMLHMTGLVAERDTLRQQLAERDAEIERLRAPTPTCFCGLRMTLNPHPDAGKPERLLEVGAVYVCIPCLNKANHGHCKSANALRQQRDKLAGLLREARVIVAREVERWTRAAAILPVNANVEPGLLTRINAALAEVNK